MKFCTWLIIVSSFTLLTAGCDDEPVHYHRFDTKAFRRISDQVQPVSVGRVLGDQGPSAQDDSLASAPASETDPLAPSGTGSIDDPLGGNDPLLSTHAQSSDNHVRPIKNWYWMRGSITGGSVEVKIDGVQIGNYSVHVDTEISDYLNAGENDVTFVQQPTVPGIPVSCHLEVVYSQQPQGSLPVLTYDTTQAASDAENQSQIPVPAPGSTAPSMPSLTSDQPPTPVTLQLDAE